MKAIQRSSIPVSAVLVLALTLPLTSSAHAPGGHHHHDHDHQDVQTSDDDDDFDSDSPFERLEPLPGMDPPSETKQRIPAMEAVEHAPEEAVSLRLRLDAPVTYDAHHVVDLELDGEHHFTPRHRSSLQITYQPIDDDGRDAHRHFGESMAPDADGQLILGTVDHAQVAIDAPRSLVDDATAYQLYDDAQFSFRLGERGQIGDIRVHRSTNPIVMTTVSEIAQYFAQSMPALPEEPVAPGDTWDDTFTLEETNDEHTRHQEVDMIYRFEEWVPCGDAHCAAITVHSDLEAAGRHQRGRLDTHVEAAGQQETTFFLDPEAGQVVASRSSTHAHGHTHTDHDREDEGIHRTVEFDHHVHIDSLTTRRP